MDTRLPAGLALRLARASKIIAGELDTFEEQRNRLIHEVGVEVEGKPGFFNIPEEAKELFENQMAELESVEVPIQLDPISAASLPSLSMTPKDMMRLDWLFGDD